MARTADRYAPEHLQVQAKDLMWWRDRLRNYGSLFLGEETTVSFGDKAAGPNHVLPTSRSARFSSGLGVQDFLKRTTLARMTPDALAAIGPAAETLAISESLEAHGLSVRARLDKLNRS